MSVITHSNPLRTGTRLVPEQVLHLKQAFYKLFVHCLEQIDCRFPPENMESFRLMQVIDPMVVQGPLPRQKIGVDDLAVVVGKLLHTFEVSLHVAGFASLEQIQNCFTIFRVSELCSDLWREMTNEHRESALRGEKSIDNTSIYAYYRQLLLQMPNLKPWAMFALFLRVFPTGNAISERGFFAMGATHSKQRSELAILKFLLI